MTETSGPSDRVEGVEIDRSVAHVARVYDYLLGGVTNFEVDREAARATHANVPGGIEASMRYVKANRRFLGRAVRWLVAEGGIRQFLDLGAGIPTVDNVHEVAQQVAAESRIVYVDDDPVVLAHAHELLTSTPEGVTRFLRQDLRNTDAVLAEASSVLDLAQPVAVMLVSMLHLFPEGDDLYRLVAPYMAAVPSGSYLVVSHLARESEEMAKLGEAVDENPTMNYSLIPRTHDQVARFFDGLELIEPGVVLIDHWHADPADTVGDTPFHGGIARKP